MATDAEIQAARQAAKEKTMAGVTDGIENETAKVLKENYAGLIAAFPELNLANPDQLSNDDFRNMAKQAIDKREIEFKTRDGGTVTITLDQINDKLMSDERTKQIVTDRGASHVNDLIPTRGQINVIANEVGDAVAENIGDWKGTTLGNAIKGGFNWAWNRGKEGSTKEPAAKAVKDSVTERLNRLRENDEGIARILKEDDVTKISDKMWGVVMHGEDAAQSNKDPLDSVAIKDPGDALRDEIANQINHRTYDATYKGLTKRVGDELEKVRNNGFMGMIFRFLEAIGLGGFVAKLFGMPIPKDQELKNVSKVVADTVSTTVKEHGASMSRDELIATVRDNVRDNLRSNRRALPSFNDKQINEIAEQAAQGVNDNYDKIPKLPSSEALAQANQAVDREAGIGGAEEAEYAQAPTGGKHRPPGQQVEIV